MTQLGIEPGLLALEFLTTTPQCIKILIRQISQLLTSISISELTFAGPQTFGRLKTFLMKFIKSLNLNKRCIQSAA